MTAWPGEFNELEMVKYTDFGIYLDGGDLGEILMPTKYVPPNTHVGEKVRCFVYFDTVDRIIATTEEPKATVKTCALLTCVATTKFGAFMNWGLTKDLLVPFKEQNLPLEEGKSYVVYVYLDEKSRRIVGSVKLDKHLNRSAPTFNEGDKVDLIIARKTDSGYVAVINNTHTGLLYHNEIFTKLEPGDKTTGFIKTVRGDGKIDLTLQLGGYDQLEGEDARVLNIIKQNGGVMNVGDKSDPEKIYELFHMSKKNWKKVVGNLYKKRLVSISDHSTHLISEED